MTPVQIILLLLAIAGAFMAVLALPVWLSGRKKSRSQRPGRNQPCWCGNGKKYKTCHLAADERR